MRRREGFDGSDVSQRAELPKRADRPIGAVVAPPQHTVILTGGKYRSSPSLRNRTVSGNHVRRLLDARRPESGRVVEIEYAIRIVKVVRANGIVPPARVNEI